MLVDHAVQHGVLGVARPVVRGAEGHGGDIDSGWGRRQWPKMDTPQTLGSAEPGPLPLRRPVEVRDQAERGADRAGDRQCDRDAVLQVRARRRARPPHPVLRRMAMRNSKAAANAAQIAPQLVDDAAPANYYRALKDVAAWTPDDAIIIGEGASTMDIGRTQLFNSKARHRLDAGSYGTMGIGMGFTIAAAVVHPDKPIISVSGDSAIGFSGMEMETACRYQLPVKIVVFNNGGIGPGHAKHPGNPLQNLKPNALIYGARYDKMMEAFGGKGWFVENPKDLRTALQEAMDFRGPALVNIRISQESARKPQQFRWHS